MNDDILRVLRFTNSPKLDEEIIVEDCGKYVHDLDGYCITLPKSSYSDMDFLIRAQYGEDYYDLIISTFNGGDSKAVAQLCKIFLNGKSYTELFIEKNGGVTNLIVHPSGGSVLFDTEDYEEVEDPEMIRELEEEIKKIKEELALEKGLTVKLTEENKTLLEDKKIISDRLKAFKPLIDDYIQLEDLELDDADMICDIIASLDDSKSRELMEILIGNHVKDADLESPDFDINSLHFLKIFLNQIAVALEDVKGV